MGYRDESPPRRREERDRETSPRREGRSEKAGRRDRSRSPQRWDRSPLRRDRSPPRRERSPPRRRSRSRERDHSPPRRPRGDDEQQQQQHRPPAHGGSRWERDGDRGGGGGGGRGGPPRGDRGGGGGGSSRWERDGGDNRGGGGGGRRGDGEQGPPRRGGGGGGGDDEAPSGPPPEVKVEPNFGVSGKLAAETNELNGTVMKFQPPPEARRCTNPRWRLYIFKGDQQVGEPLPLDKFPFFLFGKERRVADIPTDHPSCSRQHAVIVFREVERASSLSRVVVPYIIDLETVNGTFVNGERIEASRYVELLERDVIKFGLSTREYVLLNEKSAG